MGPLQIPETFVAGFVALANLPAAQYDRLVDELTDGPLVDLATLADSVVAGAADVDVDEARGMVASLTSLFGYRRRAHESVAEVAAGIAGSAQLDGLDADVRGSLASRIERLLVTRAISGSAKAMDLQLHRHAISSLQVVTETRFLFDEEDRDPSEVYGAVLTHTLRIQTYDDDRDLVFTMSDRDLVVLRTELDRAEVKRAMIGDRLRRDGFDIFNDGGEAHT